ncbi:hypothetical protein COW46_01140 [Candidatus Gracilibacteria bacterium CG17_big_fil_post_rev_8_21_14_2_50_48_13]|nr:MAG: hypothetical protein COW46_01140 [Candidatus Gracilibacteria bacterium CG17_big_fil_post_rev_8_21_14_2_50_48_13]
MLREIYGTADAQCAFPALDLEQFVVRALGLTETQETLFFTQFVSDICHRFASLERTPDNLLMAHC